MPQTPDRKAPRVSSEARVDSLVSLIFFPKVRNLTIETYWYAGSTAMVHGPCHCFIRTEHVQTVGSFENCVTLALALCQVKLSRQVILKRVALTAIEGAQTIA